MSSSVIALVLHLRKAIETQGIHTSDFECPGGAQTASVDIVSAIEEYFGRYSSFSEIFLHFVDDLTPHLERLVNAFEADEADMVRHEAHSLKGASGSCCAQLAYQMCQVSGAASRQLVVPHRWGTPGWSCVWSRPPAQSDPTSGGGSRGWMLRFPRLVPRCTHPGRPEPNVPRAPAVLQFKLIPHVGICRR
jgi:HPt (histidine-containing phosphotransfer) domain-containing protein